MFQVSILFQPKLNRLERGELPETTKKSIELVLWSEDAEAWKMKEQKQEIFEFSGSSMQSVKAIARRVLRNQVEPTHLELLFKNL